jgi:hypothetical protein
MRPRLPSFGINRRVLLAALAVAPVLPKLLFPTIAQAQSSPPASWNDRPAKQAILDFMRATTDRASSSFVPPEERIATFDQDGTLVGRAPGTLETICKCHPRPRLRLKAEVVSVSALA